MLTSVGGCPYAPGASGNVATEDVIYLLQGMGCTLQGDVDLNQVAETGEWICAQIGRVNRSRVGVALAGKRARAAVMKPKGKTSECT